MRRYAYLVPVLAALWPVAGPTKADHPHLRAAARPASNALHAFGREWAFNNAWPQPFVMQDRQAVRAPFAIMIDKGWQLQNTLGDYHFDQETQQLTRAGELQLKWILTQTPESRRTIFVLRGHNEDATSVRVDTVQQAVAQLQPRGPLPAVVQTNNVPPASPAEYADDVQQKAIKARPVPTLPAASTSSGGGSSGASGS